MSLAAFSTKVIWPANCINKAPRQFSRAPNQEPMDANVEHIAHMQRILDRQLDQMERDLNRARWKNALIYGGQFAIGAGIMGLGVLVANSFF